MINKEVSEMKGKKYDKFAITSFVFIILGLLISFVIPILIFYFPVIYLSIILIMSVLVSITFGVISLIRIKRNNKLKGRKFAWAGIIISVLSLLLLIIITIILISIMDLP